MYAVIQTGGKQYRVAPGQTIEVEKLPGDAGTQVELGQVIAVMKDSDQLVAGPDLGDAKVTATIAGHGRGSKVVVFKFKCKKQYKRTIGHRQSYTRLKVDDIVI
ncbi:MAG: 50S ribosomal protein L21 [Bryobacteraceae bacterium]|nr:50S ribosomal protein L21 [Bryobacterales bacterium]NUN00915.1 50S ribosomal protein L21 [Bryobacteraceae bacterium]